MIQIKMIQIKLMQIIMKQFKMMQKKRGSPTENLKLVEAHFLVKTYPFRPKTPGNSTPGNNDRKLSNLRVWVLLPGS